MQNKELQKRIRIFAGPNGSGKSTLYIKIKQEYNLRFGYYINADEIYEKLNQKGFLDAYEFGLKVTRAKFISFYKKSGWKDYVHDKNYTGKWKFDVNIISIDKGKLE